MSLTTGSNTVGMVWLAESQYCTLQKSQFQWQHQRYECVVKMCNFVLIKIKVELDMTFFMTNCLLIVLQGFLPSSPQFWEHFVWFLERCSSTALTRPVGHDNLSVGPSSKDKAVNSGQLWAGVCDTLWKHQDEVFHTYLHSCATWAYHTKNQTKAGKVKPANTISFQPQSCTSSCGQEINHLICSYSAAGVLPFHDRHLRADCLDSLLWPLA